MRLRSGKALSEMARPPPNNASTSKPHNNVQSTAEQSTQALVSGAKVSNIIGAIAPTRVLTFILVTAIISVSTHVASLPTPVSFLITPLVTNSRNGNSIYSRFPFVPQFSLPMATRDYPYGMPTTMMACLQTNVSTYADNTTNIFSLLGVRVCTK